MGCDYYIGVYLFVSLKNNDTSYHILLHEDVGYWSFSYDSDSENGYERAKDEEITRIFKTLPKDKVLFENDEWKISSEDKKKNYLYYLHRKSIDLSNVDKLVKTSSYRERG